MLHRFDAVLLERIEKFSHGWQRTFGQDCFWWARAFFAFSAVSLVIGLFFDNNINNKDRMVVVAFLLPMYFLVYISHFKPVIVSAKNNSPSGLANSEKLQGALTRPVRLLMATCLYLVVLYVNKTEPDFFPLFGFLMTYSWMTAYYFVACDPLPPAKSKMRQKLESLVDALKGGLISVPEPVPVPSK